MAFSTHRSLSQSTDKSIYWWARRWWSPVRAPLVRSSALWSRILEIPARCWRWARSAPIGSLARWSSAGPSSCRNPERIEIWRSLMFCRSLSWSYQIFGYVGLVRSQALTFNDRHVVYLPRRGGAWIGFDCHVDHRFTDIDRWHWLGLNYGRVRFEKFEYFERSAILTSEIERQESSEEAFLNREMLRPTNDLLPIVFQCDKVVQLLRYRY